MWRTVIVHDYPLEWGDTLLSHKTSQNITKQVMYLAWFRIFETTRRFSTIFRGQLRTSTHSGNLALMPFFRAMVALQLCHVCWRIS